MFSFWHLVMLIICPLVFLVMCSSTRSFVHRMVHSSVHPLAQRSLVNSSPSVIGSFRCSSPAQLLFTPLASSPSSLHLFTHPSTHSLVHMKRGAAEPSLPFIETLHWLNTAGGRGRSAEEGGRVSIATSHTHHHHHHCQHCRHGYWCCWIDYHHTGSYITEAGRRAGARRTSRGGVAKWGGV